MKFFSLKNLFLALILFSACSKERVEYEDDYQSLDAFHNKYRQEEQEFVVDTGSGPCLITGKHNTRLYNICDSSMFVRKSDGSAIFYPYKIKLVEIYSASDYIFWPMSTVSSGVLIESAAALRVRAFKDNDELNLVAGRTYSAELDTMSNIVSNMVPYFGVETTNDVNWFRDAASSVVSTPAFYSLTIGRLGWTHTARNYGGSGAMTTISVTAKGTNTQNIDIFLVFKNFKAIEKLSNLVSDQVPAGEPVTFIAFAMNQNNQYVYHKEDFNITSSQNITLDLKPISESDLVNMIKGL